MAQRIGDKVKLSPPFSAAAHDGPKLVWNVFCDAQILAWKSDERIDMLPEVLTGTARKWLNCSDQIEWYTW